MKPTIKELLSGCDTARTDLLNATTESIKASGEVIWQNGNRDTFIDIHGTLGEYNEGEINRVYINDEGELSIEISIDAGSFSQMPVLACYIEKVAAFIEVNTTKIFDEEPREVLSVAINLLEWRAKCSHGDTSWDASSPIGEWSVQHDGREEGDDDDEHWELSFDGTVRVGDEFQTAELAMREGQRQFDSIIKECVTLELEKEMEVYTVGREHCDKDASDKDFIAKSNEHGSSYSLEDYQSHLNEDESYSNFDWTRFIEVDKIN